MRELQLSEARLDDVFADIHALATGCRFRDCRHEREPRCAVREAAADGRLAPARLESFHKLQRELAAQARRQDELLQQADKRKWKSINKAMRQVKPKG
jgi:ribosome biogenesis GTPase